MLNQHEFYVWRKEFLCVKLDFFFKKIIVNIHLKAIFILNPLIRIQEYYAKPIFDTLI